MKLAQIKVKDFRSFAGTHTFEVMSGVNYFVGPNNCGKSNLIRAIELALDIDARYEPAKDRPARTQAAGAPNKTRITLVFHVDSTGPERTLLRYAEAYEQEVRKSRGGVTHASAGEIHMVTTFETDGSRKTTFAARGSGAAHLSADSVEHQRLEGQFRKLVRFGVVHSGEDLGSLLQGKFRQILQLVIQDHLSDELTRAEESRAAYLDSLQTELLEPLRLKVLERVRGFFPEITAADLIPDLPTVDQTLSSVAVRLGDFATTDLAEKGTGVRGAVLVSMLQYMAEQSRRSLVMSVEEPEAFLHPGGQEEIGNQLERLATRADVSLLVTTHSPYVVSRSPTALVTELRKGADGVTRKSGSVAGNQDRADLLGGLYRDAGLARVLERSLQIPSMARVVVVTEGYTDGLFVRLCCEAAGCGELLDGVHFIPAGSATKVVPQVLLTEAATEIPVLALLDADPMGQGAFDKLKSFDRARSVISLRSWPGACNSHDIEIENLLPVSSVTTLIERLGQDAALDGMERCKKSWHYRTSRLWKEEAIRHLSPLLPPDDPGGMVWLASEINKRAKLSADSARRRDAHRPSPR